MPAGCRAVLHHRGDRLRPCRLCYSELASISRCRAAPYTYAQATLGELVAWIIGWDLVLEYAIGAATVSVSWSRHLVELFDSLGVTVPAIVPIAGVRSISGRSSSSSPSRCC